VGGGCVGGWGGGGGTVTVNGRSRISEEARRGAFKGKVRWEKTGGRRANDRGNRESQFQALSILEGERSAGS